MNKRWKRIAGTGKRLLEQLLRDRRTIAMLVIAPALAIFVFGEAFSGNVEDVKTGYINADHGVVTKNLTVNLGDAVIQNLAMDGTLDLIDEGSHLIHPEPRIQKELSLTTAREAIKNQEYTAFIVIGPNFSQMVISGTTAPPSGQPELVILVDGSNPQVASAIIIALQKALQEIGSDTETLLVTDYVYGGPDVGNVDAMAPGLITFFVFFFQYQISLITLVKERKSGTLERILATPCGKIDIILGYILGFSVIAILQVTIVLVESLVLFDIMIEGAIWLVYAIILLFAIVSLGIGIMASGAVTTEFQAIQLLPIVILPSFLLSGLFWPVEGIPDTLRPFAYLIPLTYAIRANRSVMLKGLSFHHVWLDISVLLLFVVIFIVGARVTFKEEV